MKKVLWLALLSLQLSAYEVGDTVSNEMVSQLGLSEHSKLYVVDFFASWCGSCQKELPLIATLDHKMDHSDVEIIGIDVDKDPEIGLAFQKELQQEHQLSFRIINDAESQIIGTFNPIGMPTLYFIKDKRVIKIITGATDHIDEKILTVVKEQQ